MKEASLVAFNLLLNGLGSFAIGALLAMGAARMLRGSPGRATVCLLTLPFAKVVLDAARGIPDQSFLWLRAQGVSQDLGSFRAGVGIERVIPKIDFSLGALSGGVTYSQSAPDLAASGLLKYVGDWAPGAVVLALAVGAALQLARRGTAALRARALRLQVEVHPARSYRMAGRCLVPVHVVPGLVGSPFTGGIVRPYVAFPEELWLALSDAEREAAILHELAHVAELHLPWMIATGLVRDVFWFVPFVGRFHERLAAACELAADAIATKRGADPVALASALVRTRELAAALAAGRADERADERAMVLGAARGALVHRVERLLAPALPASRFARGRALLRVLFVAWAAAAVVVAVPFGNHSITPPRASSAGSSSATNYYTSSRKVVTMSRSTWAAALLLVACSTACSMGCAAKPAPLVVRAADVGNGAATLAPGQSLVIEFQPGDEIPLDVSVEGSLVRSPKPGEPIRLKVVRHFFLRVDEDGIATSLDGKTFGDHTEPGAFRFGIGATKAAGVAATIAVRTPTPREPGG